ncbi:AAA domain protein [Leptospira fainei serovar Hurstbridge str. BUT 6]|uniref:AAA domain protein n=1 Tax=Leptospira fainei serovar Hurstbridge str. BUT 6 TaxID=1193011 RepID=S3VGN5_9LEPT|nr:AAA domain-containing protein [Leptospira fainei]EPG75620.1 AAA domain protein [Leptospira fainei serovar Hurstbridge str. BUT 6]
MSSRYEDLRESLQKEREAEVARYKEGLAKADIGDRISAGICIYPIVFEDSEVGPEGNWRVFLRPTKARGVPEAFRAGAPVRLFKESEELTSVLLKCSDDSYTLTLEEVPDWIEEGKLGLEILPDETSYREWDRALQKIIHSERGTRAKFFADLFLDEIELKFPNFTEESGISPEFNDSQRRAISAILETEDLILLHGPPGTGKTKTITEAIRILVDRGKKIIASAPTNAATDLLAESLGKMGVSTLRIGHPARMSESVLSVSLDANLNRHPDFKLIERDKKEIAELLKKAGKYKRTFGKEEAEERKRLYQEAKELRKGIRERQKILVRYLLESHPVIVSTHTGASSSLLDKLSFDYAILDEGSQATEPSSWIPILRAEKIVIAGDPRQLPPTVLSEDPLLKIPLMERLLDRMDSIGRVYLLDTQYRMTDPIQSFPNRRFYGGRLVSGISEEERSANPFSSETPVFGSSFVFIDTSGTDTGEELFDASLGNRWEAEFTISILKRILESGWLPEDLVLISPYRYQRFLLEEILRRELPLFAEKIEIETVDSFQGREKKGVIFSLVRSNTEGNIGFLSEERRWNVGMTRAKRLLVLIGDGSTLGEQEFFQDLIQEAESCGEVRTAWEFLD